MWSLEDAMSAKAMTSKQLKAGNTSRHCTVLHSLAVTCTPDRSVIMTVIWTMLAAVIMS